MLELFDVSKVKPFTLEEVLCHHRLRYEIPLKSLSLEEKSSVPHRAPLKGLFQRKRNRTIETTLFESNPASHTTRRRRRRQHNEREGRPKDIASYQEFVSLRRRCRQQHHRRAVAARDWQVRGGAPARDGIESS